MTGEELYNQGTRLIQNFNDKGSSGIRGGMHSEDYRKMIVEEYFIPAAQKGCVEAMEACGDYYLSRDRETAATYYRLYLKNHPYPMIAKAKLVAKIGFSFVLTL